MTTKVSTVAISPSTFRITPEFTFTILMPGENGVRVAECFGEAERFSHEENVRGKGGRCDDWFFWAWKTNRPELEAPLCQS
jgi:hypothetical protein